MKFLVRWMEEYVLEVEADDISELSAGLPDEDLSYADMVGSRYWKASPVLENGEEGEPVDLVDAAEVEVESTHREHHD